MTLSGTDFYHQKRENKSENYQNASGLLLSLNALQPFLSEFLIVTFCDGQMLLHGPPVPLHMRIFVSHHQYCYCSKFSNYAIFKKQLGSQTSSVVVPSFQTILSSNSQTPQRLARDHDWKLFSQNNGFQKLMHSYLSYDTFAIIKIKCHLYNTCLYFLHKYDTLSTIIISS